MSTSQDFDALYSELAYAAIGNQRANAKYRAAIEGADQQRESRLRESRATSDANRASADTMLQNVQQGLNTAHMLVKEVRVSERDAVLVQRSVLGNISPSRHLELSSHSAGDALQLLRHEQENLIRIRKKKERRRRGRQRILVFLLLIGLLAIGGVAALSNIAERVQVSQTENAATMTNISTVALTPVQGLGVATVISRQSVNVRSGPGTDNSIVATVPSGTTMTITGFNSDRSWVNVRLDNGQQGWISASLLALETP